MFGKKKLTLSLTPDSSPKQVILPVLNDGDALTLDEKLAMENRRCPTCGYAITNPMNDRCPRCFGIVPLSEHTNCGECSHQGNCSYASNPRAKP